MGAQYFAGSAPKVCEPVPLSPEVKAYIDKMLAANAANAQCGDIPAVLARVNDIESKMGSLQKFEELRSGLGEKREAMNQQLQNSRQQQNDVLSQLRNAELGRLRNEMAMMCAGIQIRNSVGGGNGAAAGSGGANFGGAQGGGLRRGTGRRNQGQGGFGGQGNGQGQGNGSGGVQGGAGSEGNSGGANDGAGANQN